MDVEAGNNNSSASHKRRHPDASSNTTPKTSLEILELVEKPNFEELARHHPAFQEAWKVTQKKQKESRSAFSSNVTRAFTVELTRALLQAYFNLKLPYLENNHLCPPVPNRFFYIHWIQTHLLHPSHPKSNWGMDIGTGATCIYPLLASRFFEYNMVGSEIDTQALSLAKSNVSCNQLEQKIHLLEVNPSHSQEPSLPPGGPLERALKAWNQPQHLFDFVMTNPPFYDPDSMEHSTPRAGDGRARTEMTVSEGNYPGGEVGFVTDMIVDSLKNRQSSRWFSSMFGKKTSFIKLRKLLVHLLGPAHLEATEYGPGQYTRWFIAWTFEQPRPTAILACVKHPYDTFEVTSLDGVSTASDAVKEVASRIDAFCESSPGGWGLASERGSLHNDGNNSSVIDLQITESMPLAIKFFVDESDKNAEVPPSLIEALRGQDNSHFLPDGGHHFVIQVSVQATSSSAVRVHMECYRHSSHGLKAIEKIRQGIVGEVCRTNRKWRRIVKRQMHT